MTALRRRARRLTVTILVLVLVGAGTAAAYWTATTQLSTTASSTAVGLEQAMLPHGGESPLEVTFTSETVTAAGAVALTNTGSREAEYSLIIDATSTGAPALPAALRLAAGALAAGQECTPGFSDETTGTGAEPLTLTGSLEAGATIELCLTTTLTAEAIAAHFDQTITLSLTSSLRYAAGEAWTVRAGPARITQTVGPRESTPEQPSTPGTSDFVSDGARYRLLHGGACIQHTEVGSTHHAVLETACNGTQSQWRLTPAGDGTYTIDWATNTKPGELAQPRWTATGAGESIAFADARGEDAAQRWIVSAVGENQYRLESVAYPGQVLTVGDALWNSSDTGFRRLSLEPAADLSSQAFTLDRVGNPFPALETMTTRADGPWEVQLGFTRNTGNGRDTGYDQELSYRVFLAPERDPDARMEHPAGALTGTTVQFTPDSVKEYAQSSQGGYGNSWVHIEQKLPGGEWTPAAVGKIHISPATAEASQAMGVYAGWR